MTAPHRTATPFATLTAHLPAKTVDQNGRLDRIHPAVRALACGTHRRKKAKHARHRRG
jgi:hypothetical protein